VGDKIFSRGGAAMETQVTTKTAQLVNVSEAAQFLAVSPSTLYGWVWQRRISYIKVGRAVRFDMADLERFVAENRIRARLPSKF
jgi:excisionase family DNA binding protein